MTPYHVNRSARVLPISHPARMSDATLMAHLGMLIAEAQERPSLISELVTLLGESIHECKVVDLASAGLLASSGLVPHDAA